jgi:uncharacterized repeat protein (TIGR01451 family)
VAPTALRVGWSERPAPGTFRVRAPVRFAALRTVATTAAGQRQVHPRAMVLLAVALAAGLQASPAFAQLSCGTVYATNAGTGIYATADNGTQTLVETLPGTVGAVNGFGIGPGGTLAYLVSQANGSPATVTTYNTVTNTVVATSAAAALQPGMLGFPSGAVNPVNGWFYMAGASGTDAATTTSWQLYALNPASPATAPFRVGMITGTPGLNGDIAFDSLGNLYLLSGAASLPAPSNRIYRVGQVPTVAGSAALPATQITSVGSTDNVAGIAFNAAGEMVTSLAGSIIMRINPLTGAEIASATASAGAIYDLASCVGGNTISVRKNLPQGRVLATDQFTVRLSGGGLATTQTATTTGSASGLQTPIVGPLLAMDGTSFTIDETASGGALLANYTRSWQCVDTANGNTVVAGGTVFPGTPVSIPISGGATGASVVCTITNAQTQTDFGTCDARMFLDQTNTGATLSTLYNVGYASTPFTYASLGSGAPRNGIGYNQADNYIYGIEWGGFSGNELVRVGADGSSVNLGAITGLPASNYNNGVISPAGDYYLMSGFGGTTLYRVNLTTRVATAVTLSSSISVSDFAWHNGLLWGVNSNAGALVSIDPVSGTVTTIGSSSPVNNAIAMWGFDNGLFASGGSTIYAIDPATGAVTLMSTAPGATNGDGANCPGAAIQFNADLSVTKTNTPASGPNDLPTDTYSPGETRTYTIVVTNLSGSFGAQNITVSDPIPTGIDAATVSWSCANTSGGSRCGAASGTGALNDTGLDLPPNAVATYQVTMTVPASFTGDLTNTVTITPPSTVDDTNAANNTATDVDQSAPQLTIRKISIGGVDSFGFTGTNGVVAQTLTTTTAGSPVSGATQALTAAGTATTITESTTPATYQVTDITCTGLGAGGMATPDLANRTVALDAAATAAGANVECTFTNTLQQTDIQVVKTASPDPVISGDVVTYQIVASNNGPQAASNVLLTDVAGAGQDCTTPSTTATCTATGGASCPSPTVPVSSLLGAGVTIPTLPVGGTVTFGLQCTVTASGL